MGENKFQSLGVLETLEEFHLPDVPYLQIFLARVFLVFDYRFPRRTVVTIDGLDKMAADRPFLVAMNHTDRYNYAPFMQHLDKVGLPPLAPWVKGKYYQKPWLAKLLTWSACMPIPSRGFLLTMDWLSRMERLPELEEYRELRLLGDGEWGDSQPSPAVAEYLKVAPGGCPEDFFPCFQRHFETLTAQIVRINVEALEKGYRPLIFPQGTRSRRLTPGFSGIIQMALHLGVPILPVAVSGADDIYPGNSIFSKGGKVHYSVGELFDPALEPDAPQDFIPLTIAASRQHGDQFQILTSKLMNQLNDLLPEEYKYDPNDSGGKQGSKRFV